MKKVLLLHVALSAAFASTSAAAQTATDPYQWLETARDPKALAWAQQRTERSEAALKKLPSYNQVFKELETRLSASVSPPRYSLLGSMVLRFQKSGDHPYGILSVADRDPQGMPGRWRDVLDVDALRKAEGKQWEILVYWNPAATCLAPPVARCIIPLSPDGGDAAAQREFDLNTGQFVKGGFDAPVSRSWVTWLDRDRLLIQHSSGGAPTLPNTWAAATFLWQRGTPLSEARKIYQTEPTDALTDLNAVGTGSDRVGLISRAIDYSHNEFRFVRQDGSMEVLPLPQAVKFVPGVGPRVMVQLTKEAVIAGKTYPAETILAYEASPASSAKERMSVVYTPVAGEFTREAGAGKTVARVVVNKRGVNTMLTLEQHGDTWIRRDGTPIPAGTSVSIESLDPEGDDATINLGGYVRPETISLLRGTNVPIPLYAQKSVFDASDLRVEIKTALSKDGTDVDYYLIHHSTEAKSGQTPTLITGYGAWGVTIEPSYLNSYVLGGRAMISWLQRGGAVVWPMIRGGGERGSAWHQAAMRENRQKSYDDFIAVTEALIAEKFTTPRHVGVFGSSNGGLLAAVAATQRPDLFSAVVSDVPITDLIRMPLMGIGAGWVDEFGNPNDPRMRDIMLRYSPYQVIRRGVKYPPFLITTATSDTRTGVGHARKLAARLEEVGSPYFFVEESQGGHGVSDERSHPDLMAERMAFFIDKLM